MVGGGHVAIISNFIKKNKLKILNDKEFWDEYDPEGIHVDRYLDWIQEKLYIGGDSKETNNEFIEMDLGKFEMICMCSNGFEYQ